MAAPLSRVSLAGRLPPYSAAGAGDDAMSPSTQTAELAVIGHGVEWEAPGSAPTVYARIEWPDAGYDEQSVLCVKGQSGRADAMRLAISSPKSTFARWLEDRCGAVGISIRDASQRNVLGTCSLNLSGLRVTSSYKTLSNLYLPIVRDGKNQGTLKLSVSLSYSKSGYNFLHDLSIMRENSKAAEGSKATGVDTFRDRTKNDVFRALVDYVDRRETRARDLFTECDTNKNGSLDRQEMLSLLEKLLERRPAGAELRFFWDMIDMDDDGKISFWEFTKAIRDCRAAVGSARGEDSGTKVNAVMRKLGVHILGTAGVDLESAFDEFDDGSGSLVPSEVVSMVRSLMPDLSTGDQRLLLANVSEMDVDGDGKVSLEELRVALTEAFLGAMSSALGTSASKRVSSGSAQILQVSSPGLSPPMRRPVTASPSTTPGLSMRNETGGGRPSPANSMAHSTASKDHIPFVKHRSDTPDILDRTPARKMVFSTPAENKPDSSSPSTYSQWRLLSKDASTPEKSTAYTPSASRYRSTTTITTTTATPGRTSGALSRLSTVTAGSPSRPASSSTRYSRAVSPDRTTSTPGRAEIKGYSTPRSSYSPSYSSSYYSARSTRSSTVYDSPDSRLIIRPYHDDDRMRENNKLLRKELALMKEHMSSRAREAELLSEKLKHCQQGDKGGRRSFDSPKQRDSFLAGLESKMGSIVKDQRAADEEAIQAWKRLESSVSGFSRVRPTARA